PSGASERVSREPALAVRHRTRRRRSVRREHRCARALPVRGRRDVDRRGRRTGRGASGGHDQSSLDENVLASADGSRLYVTVGSNSDAAENGIENEESRAAILEIVPASGEMRVFASGLRNPNGLAWEPVTGRLWT